MRFPNHIEDIMDPPIEELWNLVGNPSNVISFGQGTPFYYPDTQLMRKFWNENRYNPILHQYSPDLGLSSTRKEVARYLSSNYKMEISWENVVLTSGANTAFFNLIATITEPNDEILLISPYYFNHFMALQLLKIIPIEVETDENFLPIIESISNQISAKTRAIVIISPNNPTGAVYDQKIITRLIEICEEHEIVLICDETYSEFVYKDNKFEGYFYQPSNWLIHIGSFSKSLGIPGWRIGYIVLPKLFIHNFIKIQDTITISPPTISQLLVEFLLKNNIDLVRLHQEQILESRKILLTSLEECNIFEVTPTTGAFYFFARLLSSINGTKFAKKLAINYDVIVIPGVVFGRNYKNYIRFSFAQTRKEKILEGFERLENFIKSIQI